MIPQNENQVKFLFEIEGDDDRQVLENARTRIESVIYALTLLYEIPFMFEEPKIESKVSISEKHKKIIIYDDIESTEKVLVKKRLEVESLARVSELAAKIDSISLELKRTVSKILKWFCRAIRDDDSIDRFIQLYIALEIIGEFKYRNKNFSRRVKQVLIDQLHDSYLAKDIVDLRGALLHSGEKDKEVKKYIPYMTNTILGSVRKIVGLK